MPADSTTDQLQLLVLVSTLAWLVAVKTHDVYLINFLSDSPRSVAWGLGEDQEKGASPPLSLRLWGTKTDVKMLQRILSSSPSPPGGAGRGGWGEAGGGFT